MFDVISLIFGLLISSADAQTCPTRPPGDSTNACASTAFVNTKASGGAFTANLPVIGGASGGLAQGTRSGTTTKFPVVDGTTTNGQCAVWDASGGLSSVACSPSGSGTVGAGNVGDIAQYTGSTAVAGIHTVPVANGGALCYNLEEFGGVGDGTTANDTAMTNLLTAAGASPFGICIEEGVGTYSFTSAVAYTFPVGTTPYTLTIRGAGAQNTKFLWPSALTGFNITYNSPGGGLATKQTVHFEDFSVVTGGATTSSVGIKLTNASPAASYDWNTIRDVTIGTDALGTAHWWGTGLLINGVSYVNVSGLNVLSSGGNGIGMTIEGNSGGSFHFGIIYNVTQSLFNSTGIGINLATFWQGLMVSDSTFLNGTLGINIGSGGSTGQDQLMVNNNLFNTTSNGVQISTESGMNSFIGNYFLIPSGVSGISCSLCDGGQIVGNRFQAISAAAGAGIVVVSQGAAVGPGFTITGNEFYNLAQGVDFIAGASGVANVQSNAYSGVTNPTLPASTTGTFRVGGGSN